MSISATTPLRSRRRCVRRSSAGITGFTFGGLLVVAGCGTLPDVRLPNESTAPVDSPRFELLTTLVHISDAQIVDEESPGRLTVAAEFSGSAWRAYEAYSTQLLDGMVRTINKIHVARQRIDFVIHTGDATDNVQINELRWFVAAFDGGTIDPLTGPDGRDAADRPEPLLDPHRPFEAQGLYRNGVHGDAPTIAWYGVLGNHDRFAVGVFPIVSDLSGRRTSPLPLQDRIPLTFPVVLDPVGRLAFGAIMPENPGPPPPIALPTLVQPNPDRRYYTDREFVAAHLAAAGEPPGHGFDAADPGRTWYSVSPNPGLRLIVLNSATPLIERPTFVFSEGAISLAQVQFLRGELSRADARGEVVIVATHHPSESLELVYGTALSPRSFRDLLNEYPCVKLHLCGHWHTNAVFDRGGYVEMVTGAIIDAPQQGRVIEVWKATGVTTDPTTDLDASPGASPEATVELRYRFFSHLDPIDPPNDAAATLFEDPLLEMRQEAAVLAGVLSREVPTAGANVGRRAVQGSRQ